MLAFINSTNAIEAVLALIGVVAAIASFAFFLATLKIGTAFDQKMLTLAQRQQRQYDRTKVLISLQATRTKDIENFLRKNGFFERSEFPSQDLPSEDTEI